MTEPNQTWRSWFCLLCKGEFMTKTEPRNCPFCLAIHPYHKEVYGPMSKSDETPGEGLGDHAPSPPKGWDFDH